VLIGASLILRPLPRLVWNASASAPEGLYLVSPQAPLAVGDFVVARIPARYRRLAAIRRYLPANLPLVKQIAGGAGDQVCALGRAIFLNGLWLAERRVRDGAGRPMPVWQGCVRLGPDDYFLLMAAQSRSFDGRYFGVTRRRDILGRARLLWAR
jgi:conjugative transfer signal peptidase TraF